MSDNLTGVLCVLICVLGPIWLTMHYRAKARGAGQLGADDGAALDRALQAAQLLEQRVAVLERILDAELPAWRSAEPAGPRDRQAGWSDLQGRRA